MTKQQNQPDRPNRNKIPKGLWQITLPLMTVMIFGLGCITAIYMTNGKYRFEVDINRDGIKLQTNMDKTNKGDRSSEVDEENPPTLNN